MNKIKQLGKKIVSATLLPAMLAGAIAISPKKATAEEVKKPAMTLKIEDLYSGTDSFCNDKLRMTLDNKLFTVRVDKNNVPGKAVKQSQLALDLKLVQKPSTKFVVGYAGNIAEKGLTGDYGPYGALEQSIGELPLIGKSILKAFWLSSFKSDVNPMHRGTITLLSDRLDLAFDEVKGRDNKLSSRYFAAIHNSDFYLSLGKSAPNQIQAVFTNMKNEDIGVFMLGNYNTQSRALNISFFNSYGGADAKTTYTLPIGRLATNIFNTPGIEVKRPLLTGYLTFGSKTTHGLDIHTEPGKWSIANQLGFSIDNTVAVGAGASISQERGKALKVAPIAAAYFKPKIFGQEVYLEFMLQDGKFGAYTHTTFRF